MYLHIYDIAIMLGIKKSSQIIAGNIFWNSAGLQRMSFHLTSCWYNTDEKKINPWRSHCISWSLHLLLMSAWVCSGHSSFLPHPKGVHREELKCLSCPSLGECGCGWVCPVMKWFPACVCVVGRCPALSCQDGLWTWVTLNGNK